MGLAKTCEPQQIEPRISRLWEDGRYFTPEVDHQRNPFVIIMPPPNVTGELHMGHALTATLEDIMIRWHRMKGDAALWLPGVDHAGIATQVVVERQLANEGLTRHDLGRERFVDRMWDWVAKSRGAIMHQHQRLGISCDWTRERFTLDEGPCKAVRTTFINLYNKGLIYRGNRIISWCPRCHTALSDLEVEHKDLGGHLYYIRYPMARGKGSVTVATTRPETMLGDTAVAVNPEDTKYRKLIGRKVRLPIANRTIPIIGDSAVELEFGTGALKITPAHDPVDFAMAERHDLPLINVLNEDGTMNDNAGSYQGYDRFNCREAVISQLREENLLEKIEPYSHSVGHCNRCNTIIEPWASEQWFVKTDTLAKPAIEAVEAERIKIIPDQFNKVYLHWMKNIRDWCISRQLWWGHPIPVWYCRGCSELTVSMDTPTVCAACGSSQIHQDPDVLDTWFSSALWPHSTLGWPDNTEDLGYFYPTSVMETGYDILFFWVARMIMMGIENTGEIPFHTVYLHGLIRDESGDKMSKIKGNVINPLDVIDQYGADAIRFATTMGTSPGNDVRLSYQRLEAGRNFANKLWNAGRFVIQSAEDRPGDAALNADGLLTEDKWILGRMERTIGRVNELLEDYQFGEAERQVHDFVWGEFCDWYIELAKLRLRSGMSPSPMPILLHVLETSLKLLHPFMPFVTEELWQNLPSNEGRAPSIAVALFPVVSNEYTDPRVESEMNVVIEIIRGLRNARAEHKVESSKWIEAYIRADDESVIKPHTAAIEALGKVRPLNIQRKGERVISTDNAKIIVLANADVVIPMAGMVDLNAEKQRIREELSVCETQCARLEERLSKEDFLSKAPAQVVEKEREKLVSMKSRLEKLKQRTSELG